MIDHHQDARAVIAAGRRRLLVAALIALAAAAALVVTTGPTSTPQADPVCLRVGSGPVTNGKTVIAAGVAMNVPEEGIVAGLTAAMAETHLLNLANPHVPDSLATTQDGLVLDRQSVGILQQGATWGSAEERMSPASAAKRFYSAMISVDGWETMPASELAGLVQRSAWTDGYIDDEPAARRFYRDHIDDVRVLRCGDRGAALVGAPS
ncbi:hypothetical protein [Mycobacterium adipatum]|nr:hypothetical protein [Mycobacterium adipatum]